MSEKYCVKRISLEPIENVNGTKSLIDLEYYLLENDVEDNEESTGEKVYGIEIVKRDKEGCIETETVRSFSSNKENTEHLLYRLAENTVTPIGLEPVLDDFLGV